VRDSPQERPVGGMDRGWQDAIRKGPRAMLMGPGEKERVQK